MRIQVPSAVLRFALAGGDEVRRRNLIGRLLAEGLYAVPSWEERGNLRLYDRGRLGAKRPEQIFQLAQQGPVGGPQQVERRRAHNGGTIWVARHGTPWVTTGILAAEQWVADATDEPYEPQLGLVFAAPTRSTLYVHLLGDAGLDPVAEIAVAAHLAFHTPQESADVRVIRPQPDPVSPNVYWFKAGRFERIAADVRGASVQLHPTERFEREVIRPLLGIRG